MLFATMLHREYRTYSESKHLYDSQLNRGFRVHWVIPVNAYRRNASLSNRETNARQCIKACYWGSQLTLATIVTVTHQEITGSMHRRSYHSEVSILTHTPIDLFWRERAGRGQSFKSNLRGCTTAEYKWAITLSVYTIGSTISIRLERYPTNRYGWVRFQYMWDKKRNQTRIKVTLSGIWVCLFVLPFDYDLYTR